MTSNTIKHKLCRLKDKRKAENTKNVIYKIDCKECEACYIGETSRETKTRMKEHQRAVQSREINSQIFQHKAEVNHNFDFENITILGTEKEAGARKFVEGVHTVLHENSINRAAEIPACYGGLIKQWFQK